MAWPINPRPAGSLVTLRNQLNGLYPHRSKASDGLLGDAAHQATPSDHNPDSDGVVKAFDITHDPAHGVDIVNLAEWLIKDSRTNYVIRNRQIWQAGVWKPYSGTNPHTQHLHISVKNIVKDNPREWVLKEGDDVIKKEDLDAIRIAHSEIGGWNINETHSGQHDAKFLGWVGRTWPELVRAQWKAGEAFRTRRVTEMEAYPKLKAELDALKQTDPVKKLEQIKLILG